MGEMFDVINYLELRDNRNAGEMRDKLAELRERRADIREGTGQVPLSFQDFAKEMPQKEPNYLSNALFGGVVGSVLGAAFGLLLGPGGVAYGAVSFGMVGAASGVYRDTKNTVKAETVDAYGAYLEKFEREAKHSARAPELVNYRDDNAKRVKDRQAEPAVGLVK